MAGPTNFESGDNKKSAAQPQTSGAFHESQGQPASIGQLWNNFVSGATGYDANQLASQISTQDAAAYLRGRDLAKSDASGSLTADQSADLAKYQAIHDANIPGFDHSAFVSNLEQSLQSKVAQQAVDSVHPTDTSAYSHQVEPTSNTTGSAAFDSPLSTSRQAASLLDGADVRSADARSQSPDKLQSSESGNASATDISSFGAVKSEPITWDSVVNSSHPAEPGSSRPAWLTPGAENSALFSDAPGQSSATRLGGDGTTSSAAAAAAPPDFKTTSDPAANRAPLNSSDAQQRQHSEPTVTDTSSGSISNQSQARSLTASNEMGSTANPTSADSGAQTRNNPGLTTTDLARSTAQPGHQGSGLMGSSSDAPRMSGSDKIVSIAGSDCATSSGGRRSAESPGAIITGDLPKQTLGQKTEKQSSEHASVHEDTLGSDLGMRTTLERSGLSSSIPGTITSADSQASHSYLDKGTGTAGLAAFGISASHQPDSANARSLNSVKSSDTARNTDAHLANKENGSLEEARTKAPAISTPSAQEGRALTDATMKIKAAEQAAPLSKTGEALSNNNRADAVAVAKFDLASRANAIVKSDNEANKVDAIAKSDAAVRVEAIARSRDGIGKSEAAAMVKREAEAKAPSSDPKVAAATGSSDARATAVHDADVRAAVESAAARQAAKARLGDLLASSGKTGVKWTAGLAPGRGLSPASAGGDGTSIAGRRDVAAAPPIVAGAKAGPDGRSISFTSPVRLPDKRYVFGAEVAIAAIIAASGAARVRSDAPRPTGARPPSEPVPGSKEDNASKTILGKTDTTNPAAIKSTVSDTVKGQTSQPSLTETRMGTQRPGAQDTGRQNSSDARSAKTSGVKDAATRFGGDGSRTTNGAAGRQARSFIPRNPIIIDKRYITGMEIALAAMIAAVGPSRIRPHLASRPGEPAAGKDRVPPDSALTRPEHSGKHADGTGRSEPAHKTAEKGLILQPGKQPGTDETTAKGSSLHSDKLSGARHDGTALSEREGKGTARIEEKAVGTAFGDKAGQPSGEKEMMQRKHPNEPDPHLRPQQGDLTVRSEQTQSKENQAVRVTEDGHGTLIDRSEDLHQNSEREISKLPMSATTAPIAEIDRPSGSKPTEAPRIKQPLSHQKTGSGALIHMKTLVSPQDTLVSIAENFFHDPNVAWLIADLNSAHLKETWMDGKRIVEVKSRQQLELPALAEVTEFHLRRKPEEHAQNLVTIVVQSAIDKELLRANLGPILEPGKD